MSAPKTQRAWEWYAKNSLEPIAVHTLCDVQSTVDDEYPNTDRAVLIVPEAAVKGCKHTNMARGFANCMDCGSYREWIADPFHANGEWGRWQRPRVLRVGRAK